MTKLVFITQQVDPGHPALAATVPKLEALAELVDEVVVLADGSVDDVLPANCRIRSFRPRLKDGRGLRFEAALARELRGLRGGAVVVHMCPIYAVLAAPLVRPLGVPLVLWFTHGAPSRLLRAAERASTAVTSVDERSFPLPSRKLRAIGTASISTSSRVHPPERGPGTAPARTRPLLDRERARRRACGCCAGRARCPDRIHGPSLSEDERAHRSELEQVSTELGLDRRVVLGDAVPRPELPGLFAEHDALVNNMRSGGPRQGRRRGRGRMPSGACLEPDFDSLLDREHRFPRTDPRALADRIQAVGDMSPTARAAVGHRFRERVAAGHSVRSWASGILERPAGASE